jgi:hypothetical protein
MPIHTVQWILLLLRGRWFLAAVKESCSRYTTAERLVAAWRSTAHCVRGLWSLRMSSVMAIKLRRWTSLVPRRFGNLFTYSVPMASPVLTYAYALKN